jgi:hypothetical protein
LRQNLFTCSRAVAPGKVPDKEFPAHLTVDTERVKLPQEVRYLDVSSTDSELRQPGSDLVQR